MSQFWNSDPDASFWKTDDESLFWLNNDANYFYDNLGRLNQVVLRGGICITYSFDAMGNRIVVTTEIED